MTEKNGKKEVAKPKAEAKKEIKKTETVKSGEVNIYSFEEGKTFKIKQSSLDSFIKTGKYKEV